MISPLSALAVIICWYRSTSLIERILVFKIFIVSVMVEASFKRTGPTHQVEKLLLMSSMCFLVVADLLWTSDFVLR